MEIERKFTLKELPRNLSQYPHKELEQAYLCTSPVIRIRKSVTEEQAEYILCYKSTFAVAGEDKGADLKELQTVAKVNEEVELPLSEKAYAKLLTKADGRIISKTRYLIPYETYTIELDVFCGELDGLIYAEVEFKDIESANRFVPPAWFDQDVSKDKHYRNSYLATHS